MFSRTWLVRQWLLPRTCTNSVLNVYLVIKIWFIKYRFLKSMFRLRGRKKAQLHIYKQSTPTFLSAISPIMFHAKTCQTHDIPTKLQYWIPWAWTGHVVPTKSRYAKLLLNAYLRGTWLKTKKYQIVILAYLWYVSTVRELSHPENYV
jgi:hypothetical protein